MTAPNILGVVLARRDSVGLPAKHLRPLLGRPVIDYALDHAVAAKSLTHLVVTSDDPGVRRRADARGIDAIDRPPHLCTDTASVQDVMLHALHETERGTGAIFAAAVILYGNVAVRGVGVIDRAVELWQRTGCDSVRTFCPVGKWHPAWMSRLNGDAVEPLRPGSIHRRQDLEPLLLHDGAVVVLSRASLLRGRMTPDDPHAMFGTDRRGVRTAAEETVEIDSLRDLFWAEAVLRASTEAAAA